MYEIIKMDNLGRGITYVDGKITFVPKTVVKDIVEVSITKPKSKYNEGKVTEIIEPALKRVTPVCPYFNECGGCDLQCMSYQDTIEYKTSLINNLLKELNIDINPNIIENDNPLYYRNKLTLKVSNKQVGMYKYNTHDIVKINECFIAKGCVNDAIKEVENFNIINGSVVIRCNNNDEVLLVINSFDELNIDIDYIKSKIKLVGIVLNDEVIYGDNFLYEVINGKIYKYSYDAFFQVNPGVASKLFKVIEENITEEDDVLDLYCGVGTLSLSSSKARSVLGVEIVPNAVLNAIFNAELNKCDNVKFILNDTKNISAIDNYKFNTLILDPPRSGINKETMNMLLTKLPKKIIYVSCDMETFKRDLKVILDHYEIKDIYLLDMFSYTYHSECIGILKLKKDS